MSIEKIGAAAKGPLLQNGVALNLFRLAVRNVLGNVLERTVQNRAKFVESMR